MRVPPMLEPQARAAAGAPRPARIRDADDDFLAFLEVAAEDLGEIAIGDTGLHDHGRRLPALSQIEDAARGRALPRKLRIRQLRIVLGALRGRENGPDLVARGLPDALG